MSRLVAAILLTACRVSGEFQCTAHDQCRRGDELGFCERSGYCTFPDDGCASQRRYVESSPEDLAGACLTGVVTGRYRQRIISNDATGSVVSDRRQPPDKLMISALLDDGTQPKVDYRSDGAFSFENANAQRYELQIATEGDGTVLQHKAVHLELAPLFAGRFERTASAMANIQFSYGGTAMGTAWIASTGLWTQTNTNMTSRNLSFKWDGAMSLGGPVGLLETAKNDRLYFLEFVNDASGYTTINSYGEHSISLVNSGTTMLSGGFTNNPLKDRCVHVSSEGGNTYNRFKAAFPALAAGSSGWFVEAAPVRAAGTSGLLYLALKTVAPAANGDINASFFDPYRGSSIVVSESMTVAYPLSLPNLTAVMVTVGAWVYAAVDPTDNSCNTSVKLANNVELAGNVKLGATQLQSNDQNVVVGTAKVDATWDHIAPGMADQYFVIVRELVDDGAGNTTLKGIAAYTSVERRVTIGPGVLADGHTYTLEMWSLYGYPGATSGDMVSIDYPNGVSVVYTPTFVAKAM